MERDLSFELSATHLTQLHQVLRTATKENVRGRWQPDPVPSWKDAWLNLSQCVDMSEGKAHHERAYEVEDRLIRFNSVLLRATHWVPDAEHENRVPINCKASNWINGKWKRYEQEVRGYHEIHFAAAMEDALHLATALGHMRASFPNELCWLQTVITYLPVTQQSMLYGESVNDESWADFCIVGQKLDWMQQLLYEQHGHAAKAAVEPLRWALWWSAARCDAWHAHEDMVTCLRLQRLFGSCFLPREALRTLPGDFLVIPVHVPVWNEEWERVQCEARDHVSMVEDGEQFLLDFFHYFRSGLELRESLWVERALAILAGTREILGSFRASGDLAVV